MRRKTSLILLVMLGIAIFSFLSNYFFQRSICLFHNVLGIPCPTCGMTRAYIALFEGNLKKATYYHPLFFLVPVLFFSLLYSKKKIFYLCATIFFLFWIYRMFQYFPYQEPLTFNENALYPKMIQLFLRKFIF